MNAANRLIEPARGQPPTTIDEDHLRRMTLGDEGLEREVLEIFARQIVLMLQRMKGNDPALAAVAAHTLKGSARGIGAWRVSQAAERLERAATVEGRDAATKAAIAELESATLEVQAAIGLRLRHSPAGRSAD